MKIPRPDQAPVSLFRSLVLDNPHVAIRPMFGNLSAFVNANMFFGLYGNDMYYDSPPKISRNCSRTKDRLPRTDERLRLDPKKIVEKRS